MKYKHPAYSLPYGFALSEDPAGLSPSQSTLAHYPKAVKGEAPIMRNIRIDESIHLENDVHEGGKYRFGNGSETRPAIAFKGSTGTGIRRPANSNVIAFSVSGAEEARLDASRLTLTDDLRIKSGTAFAGDFEHNNAADRTYTLPDVSGTVAVLPVAPTSISPVNTDRLIGRDTAGSGAAEEIPVGGGIEFTGGPGLQTSAFTGDVTKAAGGTSTTIANDAVTNAKAANMAQSTIKGRSAGSGTGDPEDLSASQVLTILGISGTADLVYTATPGDTPINSVTDVTIFSRDVTGVAAGDQLLVEGWFQILNSSGAGRVYIVNVDFDGAFACRITTGSLGNSTDLHWFYFSAILSVVSASEANTMTYLRGRALTAQASGANETMSAAYLEGETWETVGTDLTGTVTVTFNIQSATTDSTQTLKLRSATIRKVMPT